MESYRITIAPKRYLVVREDVGCHEWRLPLPKPTGDVEVDQRELQAWLLAGLLMHDQAGRHVIEMRPFDSPGFTLELRMGITMGAMVECLMRSKSIWALHLVLEPGSAELRWFREKLWAAEAQREIDRLRRSLEPRH